MDDSLQQLSVHSLIVLSTIDMRFLILGHDTEPEDLSIRPKVAEKMSEKPDFIYESDTAQSIPDCKLNSSIKLVNT